MAKKVNGTIVRLYAWDTENRLVAESGASGANFRRYVYGTKSHSPDFYVEGGVNYRIFSDHLGSPRVIVKVSDGTVMGVMNHDEFGRETQNSLSSRLAIGFAGGLYDPDTGLVRFGARDYDSFTGRWTTKDPILFGIKDFELRGMEGIINILEMETNVFGYSFNDPINFIDPDGKAAFALIARILRRIFSPTEISLDPIEQKKKEEYERWRRGGQCNPGNPTGDFRFPGG